MEGERLIETFIEPANNALVTTNCNNDTFDGIIIVVLVNEYVNAGIE